MTRILLPPGTALAQGERRVDGANLFQAQLAASGVVSASSQRVEATATASGTAHTLGSWQEITSATTDTVEWVEMDLTVGTSVSGANTATIIDLGIGGSGSEVAVVSSVPVGFWPQAVRVRFPIHIPVGSRVAFRCQSQVVSKTVAASFTFFGAIYGKGSPSSLVTMGGASVATTSRGVTLSGGGTVNTKTAWTEIISATTQPFGAMFVGIGGGADNSQPDGRFLVDIGVGSSGNEVAVIKDVPYLVASNELVYPLCNPLFPCAIPLGARVSARWSYSVNSGTADVILLGVPRQ